MSRGPKPCLSLSFCLRSEASLKCYCSHSLHTASKAATKPPLPLPSATGFMIAPGPLLPCSHQPARFTLLIHYSDRARMIFLILTLRCPVSTFPRPAHQRSEVCLSWHLTFDHPGSACHFSSLAGTPSIMCFPETSLSPAISYV